MHLPINTTTGKLTLSNASSAAEARLLGLAVRNAQGVHMPLTIIKRGILNVGDALDSLAFDAPVFLSDTDGKLADAAGTVSVNVGRVVPGWGHTTPDKLLLVDADA